MGAPVSSRGATAALYPRPMPDHITIGAGLSMGGSEPVISDAVRSGDLLFLSGRAAVDPVTLEVVSDSFDEQAAFVLGEIGTVLAAAGAGWGDVLRVECHLADGADFPAWNRVWCERFDPPRPARMTLVSRFPMPGILIELQVTARVPGSGS
jgi:2-iminobutanoate/2-iminopropanoate deaminase